MEIIVGTNKFKCTKFSIDKYSIFCDDLVFKKDKVDAIKSETPIMESKTLPFTFRSHYVIQPGEAVEVVLPNAIVTGTYKSSVFVNEENYSISYMIVDNWYINTKSIVGIRWKR